MICGHCKTFRSKKIVDVLKHCKTCPDPRWREVTELRREDLEDDADLLTQLILNPARAGALPSATSTL